MSVSFFLVSSIIIPLQVSGLAAEQINTTMCFWANPRASVVRDAVYIDGGSLWWKPGLSDGTYGAYVSDGNPLGLVYSLNFSTAFNTSQNLSSIFTSTSKASGGGAANNVGPNYYDGAMFTNDYQWVTYAGLPELTDSYSPQGPAAFAEDELYPSRSDETFQPGYALGQLSTGITRYVAYGAAASVASENLAYYFGGLRSASYGPIYYDPGPANESLNADQLSPTLIELDMNPLQLEAWNNYTLPDEIPSRASAEIPWLPYGERGILILIGGVIYPAYANVNQKNNASINAASAISPTFMSTVSIYDIAGGVWYKQNTTGAPGALAQGCAVVASAQDGSSHNIYWYGGFDGLHLSGNFSDDVWVLSIPSFTWTKVFNGTTSRGRAGHRCVKPYPDQMMVIGGYSPFSGDQPSCLEGGIIRIFNLSSGEEMESYNPTRWSNYSVPPAVLQTIGGSAVGGASRAVPSGGFNNKSMTPLFSTGYNLSKITTWYPYSAMQTAYTSSTIVPSVVHRRGTSKYIGPILAGAAGLGLSVALIWMWRSGTLKRLPEAGRNCFRVIGWESRIYSNKEQDGIDKAVEVDGDTPIYEAGTHNMSIHEMPTSQVVIVYELPGSSQSPPPEYRSSEGFGICKS